MESAEHQQQTFFWKWLTSGMNRLTIWNHMGKAHKNCIIGQKFCLHHITGTAFIIRLTLYAYIVQNSETFQKIYSFMHFK